MRGDPRTGDRDERQASTPRDWIIFTCAPQVTDEIVDPMRHQRGMAEQASGKEDRAHKGVALADALRQGGHLRATHPKHTARLD